VSAKASNHWGALGWRCVARCGRWMPDVWIPEENIHADSDSADLKGVRIVTFTGFAQKSSSASFKAQLKIWCRAGRDAPGPTTLHGGESARVKGSGAGAWQKRARWSGQALAEAPHSPRVRLPFNAQRIWRHFCVAVWGLTTLGSLLRWVSAEGQS